MPLNDLARIRLGAFRQDVNSTVDDILAAEALNRKEQQATMRRNAVARIVGGVKTTGNRDEIYQGATRAMQSLIPYGDEGKMGIDVVDKSVENYARLNPVRVPTQPHERGRKFVDLSESPDPNKWPMQRKYGNNIHRLQQEIYTDTNEPTGFFQYVSGGAESKDLNDKEKQYIDKLEAKASGLQQEILGDFQNKVDLDAILAQAPGSIPMEPGSAQEVGQGFEKNPDGSPKRDPETDRPIPITKQVGGVPSKKVLEWLRVLGEKEDFYRQRGIPFTPARELARQKKSLYAPGQTLAPGSTSQPQVPVVDEKQLKDEKDKKFLAWAKAHPQDEKAKRIMIGLAKKISGF